MLGALDSRRRRIEYAALVAGAGLSLQLAFGGVNALVLIGVLVCAVCVALDPCPPYLGVLATTLMVAFLPAAMPFAWYLTFVMAIAGRRGALWSVVGLFLLTGALLPSTIETAFALSLASDIHEMTWTLVSGEVVAVASGLIVRFQMLATRRRDEDAVTGVRLSDLIDVLHDHLGYRLALLNLYSSTLQNRQSLTPEEDERVSRAIQENVREAANTLAKLLTSTAPRTRTPLSDLNDLLEEFRATGIPVTMQLTDEIHYFDPLLCLYIYRFVRECLTNAAKHGPAERIEIRVSHDHTTGLLRIVVDSAVGAGTAPANAAPAPSSGIGLSSLREQAAALGGQVSVQRGDGVFTVAAEFSLRDYGRR